MNLFISILSLFIMTPGTRNYSMTFQNGISILGKSEDIAHINPKPKAFPE